MAERSTVRAAWVAGFVVVALLAGPAGAGLSGAPTEAGVGAGPVGGGADAVPSVPLGFEVYADGLEAISIVWDAPAQGPVTKWELYHGSTVDSLTLYESWNEVHPPGDSYWDVELGDGATKCYGVKALNNDGAGPMTTAACATTWDGPTAPRNLVASALSATSIQISWTAPASDGGQPIEFYRLWRDTSATGSFPFLADVEEDVLTYTHTVAAGSRYWYEVAGYNAVGFGASALAGPVTSPPAAPAGLAVASGQGQLTLTWSAASSVRPLTGYRVEVQGPSGWETLAQPGVTTTHTEAGLADGATRTYRVRAANEGGEGAPGASATGQTYLVPGAPRSVAAAPGPGAQQVQVTWQAPSPDGNAPLTYRVLGGPGPGSLALLAETTGLSFVESGLAPGEVRHYAVRAANVVGEGPASPTVSAAAPTVPQAPRDLAARGGPLPGQVRLTWAAPASDGGLPVTAYRVYRGGVGEPLLPLVTVGNQLAYTDAGASLTHNQVYAVAAVSAAGEGPASAAACAGAWPAPLGAPLGEPCPLPAGWSDDVLLDQPLPLGGPAVVEVHGRPDPAAPARYLVTVSVQGQPLPTVGVFAGAPLPPLRLAVPPGEGDARVQLLARADPSRTTCLVSVGAGCAAALPLQPSGAGWALDRGGAAELVLRVRLGGAEHVVRAPLLGQAAAAAG